MFERSRRFLRRLSQRLGEHSALHQQVVSTLQRSPTLPPADMDKVGGAVGQSCVRGAEPSVFSLILSGSRSPLCCSLTRSFSSCSSSSTPPTPSPPLPTILHAGVWSVRPVKRMILEVKQRKRRRKSSPGHGQKKYSPAGGATAEAHVNVKRQC